ncbi:MAG: xanthine dehydrogenase family protein molybdopterin-binding subunit [Betaproteobacteria bacterium]|nr:xanthine dehydrogenase family protein molybdopterin-binding subunit [Betaproteobacteria bacterium]
MSETRKSQGVGASVPRKEDARLMRGRGQFVGDIRLPNMWDVAFLRSPYAHGRIQGLDIPEALKRQVFSAEDLKGVKAIRAVSGLPGFKVSEQPILAQDKVRHVGELVAMCVASSRAEAEDLVAQVGFRVEELRPVVDMEFGRTAQAPLLHEHWPDNVFLETNIHVNSSIFEQAKIRVTREIRTSRQAQAPIEGRGVVAYWDNRLEQLTIYSSAQMPHIVRTGLSECLGLPHEQIRVIAPDVGGGFGYKGILLPEEVALGWLAMHLERPVRWLEDRREHLIASANCREHRYVITGYAAEDGQLLGVECEATVDSGAYSSYPFSACLEAAQVASILPGPYDFPGYSCRTHSVATNKCPILPYRGVARTGVCFALEIILDAIAREAGISVVDVRQKALVRPDQMPFDNITKKHFDSGDYPKALNLAVDAIHLAQVRERQKRGEPDGRRVGFGVAVYCEQAAHGTSVYAGWGIPMVPGQEQAVARITPDGGLELRIGAHSHGQSLETTLAQVAHEILGVDVARIRLIHGDTGLTPYSTGTWGSRCMVMSGGAVASACEALITRLTHIGAWMLKEDLQNVSFSDGHVHGQTGSLAVEEIARTWYLRPQDLPADVHGGGLEVTEGYKPERDSGTFGYGVHAVVVAVCPQTGQVDILDYVIVEDGGKLINPMVVDGQIFGGTAQGIGTALYEEMAFDGSGQPLGSTFSDYLLPGPTEVPNLRVIHMETLSPYTRFGQKGIGESGAIAPPAAITNAINDALYELGAELLVSPVTPTRILQAIAVGQPRRRA